MSYKTEKQSRFEHEKGKVMRGMIAHKYGDDKPIDKVLVSEAER